MAADLARSDFIGLLFMLVDLVLLMVNPARLRAPPGRVEKQLSSERANFYESWVSNFIFSKYRPSIGFGWQG